MERLLKSWKALLLPSQVPKGLATADLKSRLDGDGDGDVLHAVQDDVYVESRGGEDENGDGGELDSSENKNGQSMGSTPANPPVNTPAYPLVNSLVNLHVVPAIGISLKANDPANPLLSLVPRPAPPLTPMPQLIFSQYPCQSCC